LRQDHDYGFRLNPITHEVTLEKWDKTRRFRWWAVSCKAKDLPDLLKKFTQEINDDMRRIVEGSRPPRYTKDNK